MKLGKEYTDKKSHAERIVEGFIIVILAFIPVTIATFLIGTIGVTGTWATIVDWVVKAWATGWIAYIVVGKVNL